MIELEDYISEAMNAIVRGIKKGQASDIGDHIAPLIQGEKRNDRGIFHLKDDNTNQATIIQFEVQVTSKHQQDAGANAKGKFRLYVVDVEIGGNGKIAVEQSNTQKMQFSIPVKIPRLTPPVAKDA